MTAHNDKPGPTVLDQILETAGRAMVIVLIVRDARHKYGSLSGLADALIRAIGRL